MVMVGHQFTCSNGGRNSCIVFIVFHDKLRNYLNATSVCNSFNDISDPLPTYFFFLKKYLLMILLGRLQER